MTFPRPALKRQEVWRLFRHVRILAMLLSVALLVGCVTPEDMAPAAVDDPREAPHDEAPSESEPPSEPGAPEPEPPAEATVDESERAPAVSTPRPWPNGPGTVLRERIEAAIAAGATIDLPVMTVHDLAGSAADLSAPVARAATLKPSSVLQGEPWAEVEGHRVAFPQVLAYEGALAERPDATVRLTVTPQWARGVVIESGTLSLIRVNFHGNVPAGASDATSMPVAWSDPPAFFHGAEDVVLDSCLRPAPTYVTPMVELGPTLKPSIVARIVLDADHAFHEALKADSFAMMVAMFHEADGVYAREVGIRFALVGLHIHADKDRIPDPMETPPFAALRAYWGERAQERHVLHLFTGQTSNFAMANCIGGAGDPSLAYTFTPLDWELDMRTFHLTAIAHEWGHIFGAHHHYGNHVESHMATLMIQGYTPGMQMKFSTLSKSSIRGWAEAYIEENGPAGLHAEFERLSHAAKHAGHKP